MENKKEKPQKKKRISIGGILFVFLLLLGLSIALLPTVVRMKNEVSRYYTSQEFMRTTEDVNEEDRAKIKEVCDKYNELLYQSKRVYDPYIDNTLLKQYDEILKERDEMAILEIPKIDLTIPIYHYANEESMKNGAGHMEETSLPTSGNNTHCVVSAHNGDPKSAAFNRVEELVVGDYFYIHVNGEEHYYQIIQTWVVAPDDATHIQIEDNKDYFSLITCVPKNVNTHRLVLRGERCEKPPVTEETITKPPLLARQEVQKILFFVVILVIQLGVIIFLRKRKMIKTKTVNNHDP